MKRSVKFTKILCNFIYFTFIVSATKTFYFHTKTLEIVLMFEWFHANYSSSLSLYLVYIEVRPEVNLNYKVANGRELLLDLA